VDVAADLRIKVTYGGGDAGPLTGSTMQRNHLEPAALSSVACAGATTEAALERTLSRDDPDEVEAPRVDGGG